MIILDTSGLLAAIDRAQPSHENSARVLREAVDQLILSPFVFAELDYLVSKRVSPAAAGSLRAQVAQGVYRLECLDVDDIDAAQAVIGKFEDQDIGLTDASLVVLADRFDTRDILTLDERHFRALRDARGRPFRLLPADS